MNFEKFSQLVHARFNEISKRNMFVTGSSSKDIEAVYLAAFPEGTNPIYIKNTTHDCACCKHFLRGIGNLIAITDGIKQTVWDIEGLEYPYDVVAKKLHEYVLAQPVTSFYRTTPDLVKYGVAQSNQPIEGGGVKVWKHFHAKVPANLVSTVAGSEVGRYNQARETLERTLTELSATAAATVLKMIDNDEEPLYRGKEYRDSVTVFQNLQKLYAGTVGDEARDLFLWSNCTSYTAGFRGTSIGKLIGAVSDLENLLLTDELEWLEGLEKAVGMYESWVDPTRKNRSSSAISPKMIEATLKKVRELDREQALQRRLANLNDLTINNVLWVDNAARAQMKDGLASALMAAATVPEINFERAVDISIADFMANVLPKAKSIEALVQNRHEGNLMTMTAPAHADAGHLFKWNNDFAWSYKGNVTDSIRERVKAAGGNVTDAKMRISLAWWNTDDLDLHVFDPSGSHIFFNTRQGASGGILDVDMNAHYLNQFVRNAVENVSWRGVPMDGGYVVVVDNYQRREAIDTGCVIEFEHGGKVHQYNFNQSVDRRIALLEFDVRNGKVTDIRPDPRLTTKAPSKEVWGIKTETFVKVNTITLSPNYWDDNATGNKHWFFLLEGAKCDEPARGIYNEFLTSKFHEHRKVFEVLGDLTKCPVVDAQLTGVGFSETIRTEMTVKVKLENQVRLYNLKF